MSKFRDKIKIKSDIENSGIVTRDDIYELLKNINGETIEDKRQGATDFLESLPDSIKNEQKIGGTVKEKILNDLG